MKYGQDMNGLAKLSLSLVVAALALDVSAADAKPVRPREVEHAPETTATGSASASASVTVTTGTAPARPRRYRRRPGPRMMMPLKVDLGMTGADTARGYLPGFELRAGIHWASLSPEPTNFDIGVGGFIAGLVGPDSMTVPESDQDVVYGGAYLEAGQTLSHGDFWRTWASGRVEYMGASAFGQEVQGFGAAGRLSAELYASGVGIEPRGFFLGTYAIGVYAEAAARGLGDDVSPLQVSAGLTFRTPFVLAP